MLCSHSLYHGDEPEIAAREAEMRELKFQMTADDAEPSEYPEFKLPECLLATRVTACTLPDWLLKKYGVNFDAE